MKIYKGRSYFLAALLSLPFFSSLTNASNAPTFDLWNTPKNWILALSLGPIWENAGDSQTFHLTPHIKRTYAAQHNNHTLVEGELFIGLQEALNDRIQGQLGVELVATSNAKLSGYIWDDADPRFNNYTYNYDIQHFQVAIAGKILMNQCEGFNSCFGFMPWIGASLGIGFNNAHAFNSTPTIFEAVPTPNFGSHTQTSFSYNIKVGVQKALTCHWQLGANYEFADWGRSQLNRAPGQTMNSGLLLTHLYTNGFLFNLTYIS